MIEFQATGADAERISPGMSVAARSRDLPGVVLDGRVASVTPRKAPMNPNFRVGFKRLAVEEGPLLTHDVTIDVRTGDRRVRSWMDCDAEVSLERSEGIVLPVAGVFTSKSGGLACLVKREEGGFEEREIDFWFRGRDRVMLRSGLSEGEWIVLTDRDQAPDREKTALLYSLWLRRRALTAEVEALRRERGIVSKRKEHPLASKNIRERGDRSFLDRYREAVDREGGA